MSEKFLHRMDNCFEGSMPFALYKRSTALFASTSHTSAAGVPAHQPESTHTSSPAVCRFLPSFKAMPEGHQC